MIVRSLEAISPELALVDLELALVAREQLPEPGTAWWRDGDDDLLPAARPFPRCVAKPLPPPPPVVEPMQALTSARVAEPVLSSAPMDAPRSLPAPELTRPDWRLRVSRLIFVCFGLAAFAAVTSAITIGATSLTDPERQALRPPPIRTTTPTSSLPSKSKLSPSSSSESLSTPGRRRRSETTRVVKHSPAVRLGNASQSRAIPPLVWAPVRNARGYRVELRRNGHRIFLTHTRTARLELPRVWRYRRTKYHLRRGRSYRWVVRPFLGTKRTARLGRATVRAVLTIRHT